MKLPPALSVVTVFNTPSLRDVLGFFLHPPPPPPPEEETSSVRSAEFGAGEAECPHRARKAGGQTAPSARFGGDVPATPPPPSPPLSPTDRRFPPLFVLPLSGKKTVLSLSAPPFHFADVLLRDTRIVWKHLS